MGRHDAPIVDRTGPVLVPIPQLDWLGTAPAAVAHPPAPLLPAAVEGTPPPLIVGWRVEAPAWLPHPRAVDAPAETLGQPPAQVLGWAAIAPDWLPQPRPVNAPTLADARPPDRVDGWGATAPVWLPQPRALDAPAVVDARPPDRIDGWGVVAPARFAVQVPPAPQPSWVADVTPAPVAPDLWTVVAPAVMRAVPPTPLGWAVDISPASLVVPVLAWDGVFPATARGAHLPIAAHPSTTGGAIPILPPAASTDAPAQVRAAAHPLLPSVTDVFGATITPSGGILFRRTLTWRTGSRPGQGDSS